jgi:hypothetical protein
MTIHDLVHRAVTRPHDLTSDEIARLRATGEMRFLSQLAASWERHDLNWGRDEEDYLRRIIGWRNWGVV